MANNVYDIIGIGIGPSNLSLAALLHPVKKIKSVFLDKKDAFIWHEGMLMPEAQLQVSFLKDLVTLVDPTNPFSFLNFLSENGRIYRHFNTKTPIIKRKEFNQYYRWAIDKMDNIYFQHDVTSVDFNGENFDVKTPKGNFIGRNLIIGVGLTPYIPGFAGKKTGTSAFHSCKFLAQENIYTNKNIAVVGGGQSGAEIVNNLLHRQPTLLPNSINWISRRYNYLPLEDSPFTNELYTPRYSKFFFDLSSNKKAMLLEAQKLTSDGISEQLLKDIYNKLYELEVIDKMDRICNLYPGSNVKEVAEVKGRWRLVCTQMKNEDLLEIDADVVIYATGYHYKIPDFLDSITGEYRKDKELIALNEDFSIPWDGPGQNKIFIQNGAKNIWGMPNPNLSLNSWRSAVIINSILNEKVYSLQEESSAFSW